MFVIQLDEKPPDSDRHSCTRQGTARSLTCGSIFRQISDLRATTQIRLLHLSVLYNGKKFMFP